VRGCPRSVNAYDACDLAYDYEKCFSQSGALDERARSVLAGGAAHDSWRFDPFAPAFTRASGAYKFEVSGRDVVDFWMGHGSLLMGHGFAAVGDAVRRQATLATHLGGLHPMQIEWAEHVVALVPSAERVRFVSSGTEATLLAVRAARAYTGRTKVVRLDGHFHGWHDEALAHLSPARRSGISPSAECEILIGDPSNAEAVIELLADEDVAAVILEPGGGGSGSLPYDLSYLSALRDGATRYGALLIFDEVISGFRYAPGGVQALSKVIPDLTALAKILCGGLPGGAVAGRADIMSVFGVGCTREGETARVVHSGTFNANPLSAAAGVAMLAAVADGAAQRRAAEATCALVDGVNREAARIGVDVRLFAQSSVFHVLIGAIGEGAPVAPSAAAVCLPRQRREQYLRLRQALLLEGIDMHASHGWLSAAHDPGVIADATMRFARAFRRLEGFDDFRLRSQS